MIKILGGERGSGKTQRMVIHANAYQDVALGNVIFLDRDFNRIHDLKRNIRLVNIREYHINSDKELLCFILGLIAGDSDIVRIYIDSVQKLIGKKYEEMQEFFDGLKTISDEFKVEFFLTAELTQNTAPEFLKNYLVN